MRDLSLFLLCLSLVSCARASLDPSQSMFDYGYSQSFSYDYSSDIDGDNDEDSSIMTGSIVFPPKSQCDECYISSMTLMSSEDGSFSDDDDDENDENDGSCSMLSNAALPRVSAAGNSKFSASSQSRAFVSKNKSASPSQLSRSSALALQTRGGAAAASSGTEALQKLLVVALVTLIYEGAIGHILEFVKISMQTAPDETSYVEVIKDITAAKGIAGLWDGFCPWGVIQALFKGAVFGYAHATATTLLDPLVKQGKLPLPLALTLAGGIGGGFQGYVLSPTLLLKTRVMTNPVFRENMSMLRTTWLSFLIGAEVVRKEGLATLMKGANVFALKRVFDWSTRYFFSDFFETLFVQMKAGVALTVAEKSFASFLGGVASTLSTLPLDVLVAKMQDAKKAGVKVSALTLFQEELKEKGWSGLRKSYMRGFEARLLHVCTTTMVIKTGTPIVYDLIFGSKTAPAAPVVVDEAPPAIIETPTVAEEEQIFAEEL